MSTLDLPARAGARPTTRPENPHSQLDQQPTEAAVPQLLASAAFALPGVTEGPSGVSVPGARALILGEGRPTPVGGFMVGREFAHLHPDPDFSLHAALPPEDAATVIAAGWGEPHPLAGVHGLPTGLTMIYAPRERDEVAIVVEILAGALRGS
jgi:hypothetical protein